MVDSLLLYGRNGPHKNPTASADQEASGYDPTPKPAMVLVGLVLALVILRVVYEKGTPL
jgi:hypothetical protein